MTQIDKILIKILNLPDNDLMLVPRRELKILKNLGKLVSSPHFITENQGKLLMKILNENLRNFNGISDEISESLLTPSWSRIFRPVDKTKKIYLSTDNSTIVMEFAYSSVIRKVLQSIWRDLGNISQETSGKIYNIELTEKNIVKLVDTFKPLEFEIDEKIENFYKIIKSWSETEIKNKFLLSNFDHSNFQKLITSDLGIDTPISDDTIADRSVRYQYFLENPKKTPENLTEILAYRKNTKVWINKNSYSLEEILSSLKQIKRLPVLVIFDCNDHKKCYEELVDLHKSLEKTEIFENIGIYFRLDNDEGGSMFNKFIAENKYNAQLDETTTIVGVQNGKIPKFFLKSPWKPMSVISIGSSLKQTKTAVYANCCDLIISYTEQEPIIENKVLWE
jgi:hypothetical protein